MEPTTVSALTAVFIGTIWTLLEVVRYFLKARRHAKKEPRGLTEEQIKMIKETHAAALKLEELHAVYDDNRVPKWYVPGDLLKLIREMHSVLEKLGEDVSGVQSGQSMSVEKILELISSTKLMTERLGDLITLWSNRESS